MGFYKNLRVTFQKTALKEAETAVFPLLGSDIVRTRVEKEFEVNRDDEVPLTVLVSE